MGTKTTKRQRGMAKWLIDELKKTLQNGRLNMREACAELGMSPDTAYRWMNQENEVGVYLRKEYKKLKRLDSLQ